MIRQNISCSLFTIICSIFILSSSLLYGQYTWVKTYRPLHDNYWDDFYQVRNILVSNDGAYVISGKCQLTSELPWEYEHWGYLMKTDFNGNLLWAVSDSVNFLSENDNTAMVETVDNDLITYCFQAGVGGSLIKRDPNGNRMWVIQWNSLV
jgi:hypothetical protein